MRVKMKQSIVIVGFLAFSIIGLTGCDKIKAITQKGVDCNDELAITQLQSVFQKGMLSASKEFLLSQANDGSLNGASIRATLNQMRLSLDDIRTNKQETKGTKKSCVGLLTVNIPPDVVSRANFVRNYYEDLEIKEEAFQRDFDIEVNKIHYEIKYSVQPTDDRENVVVELLNGQDLQSFIADIAVEANQKENIQNKITQNVKELAQEDETNNAETSNEEINEEDTTESRRPVKRPQNSSTEAEEDDTIAEEDISEISRQQAQAKAEMDYKRREFNNMWNTASVEAQESLVDDQKEWVAERDRICLAEAQEAEPVYQEITRMQCITRMLSERYYEVKEYFDNYE